MRTKLLLLLCLLCSGSAFGQFTLVSGTVTDPNGLYYSYATITAQLVISGTPVFTATNLPYTPPTQPVGLSSGGSFTMQLASNGALTPGGSTWTFQVCSSAGTVPPAFGNGPICFTVAGVTLSGSSQSLSSTLSTAAPALTAAFGGGGTGCVPLSSTANALLYLNSGGVNCTTSAQLTFTPQSGTNAPVFKLTDSSGYGTDFRLQQSGAETDLYAGLPAFNDSTVVPKAGTLQVLNGSYAGLWLGGGGNFEVVGSVDLSSISRTSNVVTAICSAGCAFPVGTVVNINQVTDSSYNGNFIILSSGLSGSSTALTWSQTGSNSSSSGGHIALATKGYNFFADAGPLNLSGNGFEAFANGTSFDAKGSPAGMLFVVGGSPTAANSAGGPISMYAGDTEAFTGSPAGSINLTAGSSRGTGNNNGGSINLNPGTATGSGTAGAVVIGNVTGSTQCLHVNSSGAVSGTGVDCSGSTPPSNVVTVCASGCQATTISAALALSACSSGNCLIQPATNTTYTHNLTINQPRIWIQCQNPSTIINTAAATNDVIDFVTGSAGSAVLGCTVRGVAYAGDGSGGETTSQAGIWVNSGDVVSGILIKDVVIDGADTQHGTNFPIRLGNNSNPATATGNVVKNVTISNVVGYSATGYNLITSNNNFVDHAPVTMTSNPSCASVLNSSTLNCGRHGWYVSTGSNNTITHTTVTGGLNVSFECNTSDNQPASINNLWSEDISMNEAGQTGVSNYAAFHRTSNCRGNKWLNNIAYQPAGHGFWNEDAQGANPTAQLLATTNGCVRSGNTLTMVLQTAISPAPVQWNRVQISSDTSNSVCNGLFTVASVTDGAHFTLTTPPNLIGATTGTDAGTAQLTYSRGQNNEFAGNSAIQPGLDGFLLYGTSLTELRGNFCWDASQGSPGTYSCFVLSQNGSSVGSIGNHIEADNRGYGSDTTAYSFAILDASDINNSVNGNSWGAAINSPPVYDPNHVGVWGANTVAAVQWLGQGPVPSSTLVVGTDANNVLTAPSFQGNGTKVQLSTGATTTNDCVKFDANGNTVDAGAACGSGGGAVSSVSGSASGVTVSPTTGATVVSLGGALDSYPNAVTVSGTNSIYLASNYSNDMCKTIEAAIAANGSGHTYNARGFTGNQVCLQSWAYGNTTVMLYGGAAIGTEVDGTLQLSSSLNLYFDGPSGSSYTDGVSNYGTPALIIPWGFKISHLAKLGHFFHPCTGTNTPVTGCTTLVPVRSFAVSATSGSGTNTLTGTTSGLVISGGPGSVKTSTSRN